METDIIVIGGGATGAGVAWDLTLRGLRVILVDMGDIATGTSGRYHGLLHSGARYVASDLHSARECIHENTIIRRVAPHAIEDTGGLFVQVPGDDPAFVGTWLAGCQAAGITVQEISTTEALRREPLLHPEISCAYTVPDAACDSHALCAALQRSAEARGAKFLPYHQVTSITREADTITGVQVQNLRAQTSHEIRARCTVIAAGPWSAQVAQLAGVHYRMMLSRGAMLAYNGRWANTIISRLRPPSDGDIFIPLGTMGVAGTTSVPTDNPGDTTIEPWEYERVMTEVQAYLPGLQHAHLLRAWAGVRPLYDPNTNADSRAGDHVDGRQATRTFDVLESHELGDVKGLIAIVGGKLTTFRLMAEQTADAVCAQLGIRAACATATTAME